MISIPFKVLLGGSVAKAM